MELDDEPEAAEILQSCGAKSDLVAFVSMRHEEQQRMRATHIAVFLCATCAETQGVSDRIKHGLSAMLNGGNDPHLGKSEDSIKKTAFAPEPEESLLNLRRCCCPLENQLEDLNTHEQIQSWTGFHLCAGCRRLNEQLTAEIKALMGNDCRCKKCFRCFLNSRTKNLKSFLVDKETDSDW
jgi:hypothetical protein